MISHNLASSFKYAAQGIAYAFFSQRNFRIHVFLGLLAATCAIWLKLTFTNLAIIVISIFAVLTLELINTSIEALVDLSIGKRVDPLARIAKDCAAASVLVFSISAFIIAILLFLPELLNKLGT